jgi:hypothetical protein
MNTLETEENTKLQYKCETTGLLDMKTASKDGTKRLATSGISNSILDTIQIKLIT